MKIHVFLKNAVVLTVTSLILRTVGIFFRMFLSAKIGAEGMGLYQLIVSVYVLCSTFATTGISTAVTRLVADESSHGHPRTIRRILRRSVGLSACIGLLTTVLLYFTAGPISRYWIQDIRAIPALKIMAFSFPSMGISACVKGYFVGRRKAADTSYAQLIEQAVRIAVIVLLIDRFARLGLSIACAAVMIGDTIAEWAACGYVAIRYFGEQRKWERSAVQPYSPIRFSVLRQLCQIAVPITAGRYLNSLLRTVENLLVPQKIARYTGSGETGLSQFGALKGMALPLIFFPASFLSAMSTLLIPEISAANANHQNNLIHRAIEKSLHITLVASMLIGSVFTVFAFPLGQLLYGSRDVGLYLRVLAPLTPIMYLESIVDGILKGLNQQVSSLKYSVVDSSLRIALIWLLVPLRGMGAFLFIMVISNVLTSFLNVHRLLTVTGMSMPWKHSVIQPLIAAVVAGAFAVGILKLPFFVTLPTLIYLIVGIGVLCGSYIVLSAMFGCLYVRDFLLDKCKKKRYDK